MCGVQWIAFDTGVTREAFARIAKLVTVASEGGPFWFSRVARSGGLRGSRVSRGGRRPSPCVASNCLRPVPLSTKLTSAD